MIVRVVKMQVLCMDGEYAVGSSLAILIEVEKELEETRKELYGNNDT